MVMNVREWKMTPNLDKAVQLIAHDMGAVNRVEDQDALKSKVRGALASAFTDQELGAVEAELSMLDEHELQKVCIGGDDQRPEVNEITRRVLDIAWEAMQ